MAGRNGGDGRLVEQVARCCAHAQEPLALLEQVAALVRSRIPYDAAGWLLVDPDTMLLTGVHNEGVPREAHLELIEMELAVEDCNKFAALARAAVPAASLSAATEGDLSQSPRWSRIYQPLGYGDELRGVFRSGWDLWGNVCMARAAGEPPFSEHEVSLVAELCPHIGNGIRTCLLLTEVPDATPHTAQASVPALVVLTEDGHVDLMTRQAREWLGPLDDERLETTIVLHEVARQAQSLARGAAVCAPAFARVRTRSGEWFMVRAARLEDRSDATGRTAVVVEPARRSDVASLVLRLHQLTRREREVTRLLLSGMATDEIAAELWITTETVRGHVKSVFAKLGVRSRAEVAALLSR